MDEVTLEQTSTTRHSADIMPDLPDFVSSVDKSIVHGRASLREHNKRNNVTNAADFKNEWASKAAERAAFYEGRKPDTDLKEHLNRAYEKLRRK